MRALHLLLAIGVTALLSTPVRTQQPQPVSLTASGPAPARVSRAGNGDAALAIIQGSALSATNTKLVNAPVRLRDAQKGGVLFEQRTDDSGNFAFQTVPPGTYVVELKGDFGAVLAASDLVAVGAGDTANTIVQLHDRRQSAWLLSSHKKSALLAVLASAGAVGVLAAAPTTEVSTETPRIP